jgi:hypothetical protein
MTGLPDWAEPARVAVRLPLALIRVALFRSKEAHRFLIVNILGAIHDV